MFQLLYNNTTAIIKKKKKQKAGQKQHTIYSLSPQTLPLYTFIWRQATTHEKLINKLQIGKWNNIKQELVCYLCYYPMYI